MALGRLLGALILLLLGAAIIEATFVKPVTRVVHFHPPPTRYVYTRHVHFHEPPPRLVRVYSHPFHHPVEELVEAPLPYYHWYRK